MTTPEDIIRIVNATMERLNAGREVCNIFNAIAAVQRFEEKRVQEAFDSVFGSYSLGDLALAAKTLLPLCLAEQDRLHAEQAGLLAAAQDSTPPPVTFTHVQDEPAAKKGKKRGRPRKKV